MTDQAGISPEPLIRVARGLSSNDTVVRERHAFRGLAGRWSLAKCTLVALTSELGDDDESVPMCPLCNVFLMADNLDVSRLDADPDWQGM